MGCCYGNRTGDMQAELMTKNANIQVLIVVLVIITIS